MKITAQRLLSIADSGVLAKLSAQDISPIGAYRLGRLMAVVEPEAMRVQAARNKLITPENSTEEAGRRQVRPECVEAFMAAVTPLLAEEIEISVKPVFLADLEGAKVSTGDLLLLGELVAEPKE